MRRPCSRSRRAYAIGIPRDRAFLSAVLCTVLLLVASGGVNAQSLTCGQPLEDATCSTAVKIVLSSECTSVVARRCRFLSTVTITGSSAAPFTVSFESCVLDGLLSVSATTSPIHIQVLSSRLLSGLSVTDTPFLDGSSLDVHSSTIVPAVSSGISAVYISNSPSAGGTTVHNITHSNITDGGSNRNAVLYQNSPFSDGATFTVTNTTLRCSGSHYALYVDAISGGNVRPWPFSYNQLEGNLYVAAANTNDNSNDTLTIGDQFRLRVVELVLGSAIPIRIYNAAVASLTVRGAGWAHAAPLTAASFRGTLVVTNANLSVAVADSTFVQFTISACHLSLVNISNCDFSSLAAFQAITTPTGFFVTISSSDFANGLVMDNMPYWSGSRLVVADSKFSRPSNGSIAVSITDSPIQGNGTSHMWTRCNIVNALPFVWNSSGLLYHNSPFFNGATINLTANTMTAKKGEAMHVDVGDGGHVEPLPLSSLAHNNVVGGVTINAPFSDVENVTISEYVQLEALVFVVRSASSVALLNVEADSAVIRVMSPTVLSVNLSDCEFHDMFTLDLSVPASAPPPPEVVRVRMSDVVIGRYQRGGFNLLLGRSCTSLFEVVLQRVSAAQPNSESLIAAQSSSTNLTVTDSQLCGLSILSVSNASIRVKGGHASGLEINNSEVRSLHLEGVSFGTPSALLVANSTVNDLFMTQCSLNYPSEFISVVFSSASVYFGSSSFSALVRFTDCTFDHSTTFNFLQNTMSVGGTSGMDFVRCAIRGASTLAFTANRIKSPRATADNCQLPCLSLASSPITDGAALRLVNNTIESVGRTALSVQLGVGGVLDPWPLNSNEFYGGLAIDASSTTLDSLRVVLNSSFVSIVVGDVADHRIEVSNSTSQPPVCGSGEAVSITVLSSVAPLTALFTHSNLQKTSLKVQSVEELFVEVDNTVIASSRTDDMTITVGASSSAFIRLINSALSGRLVLQGNNFVADNVSVHLSSIGGLHAVGLTFRYGNFMLTGSTIGSWGVLLRDCVLENTSLVITRNRFTMTNTEGNAKIDCSTAVQLLSSQTSGMYSEHHITYNAMTSNCGDLVSYVGSAVRNGEVTIANNTLTTTQDHDALVLELAELATLAVWPFDGSNAFAGGISITAPLLDDCNATFNNFAQLGRIYAYLGDTPWVEMSNTTTSGIVNISIAQEHEGLMVVLNRSRATALVSLSVRGSVPGAVAVQANNSIMSGGFTISVDSVGMGRLTAADCTFGDVVFTSSSKGTTFTTEISRCGANSLSFSRLRLPKFFVLSSSISQGLTLSECYFGSGSAFLLNSTVMKGGVSFVSTDIVSSSSHRVDYCWILSSSYGIRYLNSPIASGCRFALTNSNVTAAGDALSIVVLPGGILAPWPFDANNSFGGGVFINASNLTLSNASFNRMSRLNRVAVVLGYVWDCVQVDATTVAASGPSSGLFSIEIINTAPPLWLFSNSNIKELSVIVRENVVSRLQLDVDGVQCSSGATFSFQQLRNATVTVQSSNFGGCMLLDLRPQSVLRRVEFTESTMSRVSIVNADIYELAAANSSLGALLMENTSHQLPNATVALRQCTLTSLQLLSTNWSGAQLSVIGTDVTGAISIQRSLFLQSSVNFIMMKASAASFLVSDCSLNTSSLFISASSLSSATFVGTTLKSSFVEVTDVAVAQQILVARVAAPDTSLRFARGNASSIVFDADTLNNSTLEFERVQVSQQIQLSRSPLRWSTLRLRGKVLGGISISSLEFSDSVLELRDSEIPSSFALSSLALTVGTLRVVNTTFASGISLKLTPMALSTLEIVNCSASSITLDSCSCSNGSKLVFDANRIVGKQSSEDCGISMRNSTIGKGATLSITNNVITAVPPRNALDIAIADGGILQPWPMTANNTFVGGISVNAPFLELDVASFNDQPRLGRVFAVIGIAQIVEVARSNASLNVDIQILNPLPNLEARIVDVSCTELALHLEGAANASLRVVHSQLSALLLVNSRLADWDAITVLDSNVTTTTSVSLVALRSMRTERCNFGDLLVTDAQLSILDVQRSLFSKMNLRNVSVASVQISSSTIQQSFTYISSPLPRDVAHVLFLSSALGSVSFSEGIQGTLLVFMKECNASGGVAVNRPAGSNTTVSIADTFISSSFSTALSIVASKATVSFVLVNSTVVVGNSVYALVVDVNNTDWSPWPMTANNTFVGGIFINAPSLELDVASFNDQPRLGRVHVVIGNVRTSVEVVETQCEAVEITVLRACSSLSAAFHSVIVASGALLYIMDRALGHFEVSVREMKSGPFSVVVQHADSALVSISSSFVNGTLALEARDGGSMLQQMSCETSRGKDATLRGFVVKQLSWNAATFDLLRLDNMSVVEGVVEISNSNFARSGVEFVRCVVANSPLRIDNNTLGALKFTSTSVTGSAAHCISNNQLAGPIDVSLIDGAASVMIANNTVRTGGVAVASVTSTARIVLSRNEIACSTVSPDAPCVMLLISSAPSANSDLSLLVVQNTIGSSFNVTTSSQTVSTGNHTVHARFIRNTFSVLPFIKLVSVNSDIGQACNSIEVPNAALVKCEVPIMTCESIAKPVNTHSPSALSFCATSTASHTSSESCSTSNVLTRRSPSASISNTTLALLDRVTPSIIHSPSSTRTRELTPPAVPVEAAAAQVATLAVAASTTLAVAAAAGGSAAGDLQGLVMIGAVSCASGQAQSLASSSSWTLAPLPLGTGSLRYLLGNLLIGVLATLVNLAAAQVHFMWKKEQRFLTSVELCHFPNYLVEGVGAAGLQASQCTGWVSHSARWVQAREASLLWSLRGW